MHTCAACWAWFFDIIADWRDRSQPDILSLHSVVLCGAEALVNLLIGPHLAYPARKYAQLLSLPIVVPSVSGARAAYYY
jgi:hypothetical protein